MGDEEKFVHHSHEESPVELAQAFDFAWQGVKYGFKTQRNLKIHSMAAICAILAALVLHLTPVETAIIFLCIFIVIALELVNTAIESVVDMASPEWSELAKRAKDCAAGAVFIAAIMSVVVGLYIYIPAFIRMFN